MLYEAHPYKKGLDLAVEAWEIADLDSWQLLVTGIAPEEGCRFLASRGITEQGNIRWLGALASSGFRALTRQATVYLNASRFEDFGAAQLEALLDGAVLVSTATEDPVEALLIARALDASLVAPDQTADALARAPRTATKRDEGALRSYRAEAALLLDPYSAAAVDAALRQRILPRLLGDTDD